MQDAACAAYTYGYYTHTNPPLFAENAVPKRVVIRADGTVTDATIQSKSGSWTG